MEFTGKEERDFYSEAIEFLKSMGKDLSKDKIYLVDGDTGIVMNSKTKFQRMLGHSICRVAEYVAKKQGKEVEWLD